MQTTSTASGGTCYYYRWLPFDMSTNRNRHLPNNAKEIEVPYTADNFDYANNKAPKEPIKNTLITSLRDMGWSAACCVTASIALKMFVQRRPFLGGLSAFASYVFWQVPTGVFIPDSYSQLELVGRRIAKLGVLLATSIPLITWAVTGINPLPFIDIGLSINAFALAWLDRYRCEIRDVVAPDMSRAIEYEMEVYRSRLSYIGRLQREFPNDLESQNKAFHTVLGSHSYGAQVREAEVVQETTSDAATVD